MKFPLLAGLTCLANGVMGQDNQCYITKRSARKPSVGLSFCNWAFSGPNCCLPGFDTNMAFHYKSLVQTSDSCAHREDEHRLNLKYWFCYGCAQYQGAYLKTLGERTEGSDTFVLHEISVCPSFATKLYPENFDKCGMVIFGSRASECFGDDTVIPSQHWGSGLQGAIAFLNDDVGGKPPYFENTSDDHFLVVVAENDDHCYGNSGHSLLGGSSNVTFLMSIIFAIVLNVIAALK